jgi:hypothetical protein
MMEAPVSVCQIIERFIPETRIHPTYRFENAKWNKTFLLFTVLQPIAFSVYTSYSLEFLLFTSSNYILPLLHGTVPVVYIHYIYFRAPALYGS